MKKFLRCLIVFLAVTAAAATARAGTWLLVNGATGDVNAGDTNDPGVQIASPAGDTQCTAYFWASDNATSSLLMVQGGPTKDGPWGDLLFEPVTDVGKNVKIKFGACPAYIRGKATAVSGTGTVSILLTSNR